MTTRIKNLWFFCLIIAWGCGNNEVLTVDCADAPISMSLESLIKASCGQKDGEFVIAASGGNENIQFSLDGGELKSSGTFTNLGPGEYQVNAIDNAGCEASIMVSLEDNGSVSITEISSTKADCATSNGSINITASGGTGLLSYAIDDLDFQTDNTFGDLPAGTYEVKVQDEQGCIALSTTDILENGGIIIDQTETSDASCDSSDGIITVSASGGNSNFSYSIDEGPFQNENTFTNLGLGTYTVSVKDTGGCQTDAEVSIKSNVSYNDDIKTIIQNSCATSKCHVSGGQRVDFTMFSNIQANAQGIKERTQTRNMPKKTKLTQEEIDLITCWVNDGALDN